MYGGDTLVKRDVIMLSSFNTLLQSATASCTDQLVCAEMTDKNKQPPCV